MLIGGAGEEGLANIDCNIVAMSKAYALTYIDYLRSNVAANLIVVKMFFAFTSISGTGLFALFGF